MSADDLSTPPADDVREVAEQALTMLALFRPWMVAPQQIENLRNILKPLLNAEVRPRGTVTDAEVEAAARTHYERSAVYRERTPWDELPYAYRLNRLWEMRAALEAARETRS